MTCYENAKYRQSMVLDLHRSASLIFVDVYTCGRRVSIMSQVKFACLFVPYIRALIKIGDYRAYKLDALSDYVRGIAVKHSSLII